MSWNVYKEVDTSKEEGVWEEDIYEIEVPWQGEDDALRDAQKQQVRWAKETVVDAIDCGTVGKKGSIFGVSISGHANPDHKPRSGWANDIVTVSVALKSEIPRV